MLKNYNRNKKNIYFELNHQSLMKDERKEEKEIQKQEKKIPGKV